MLFALSLVLPIFGVIALGYAASRYGLMSDEAIDGLEAEPFVAPGAVEALLSIARHAAVPEVRVAVATLADPLEVPSEDGQPVDVVILLVGPDGDPRQMLRVLARLARAVKSTAFLDGLREAGGAADLRSAFASAF